MLKHSLLTQWVVYQFANWLSKQHIVERVGVLTISGNCFSLIYLIIKDSLMNKSIVLAAVIAAAALAACGKKEEAKVEAPKVEAPAAVVAPAAAATAPVKPKIDAKGRAYATGRRKNAIARVWIKRGTGKVTVNGKTIETYFARPVLRMLVQQPLNLVNRASQIDIECTVVGGGLSGQAGAVRHGVSRALTNFEPDLRPALKKGGFLTRDSRAVERKKYGKAKARRSFQFSKR